MASELSAVETFTGLEQVLGRALVAVLTVLGVMASLNDRTGSNTLAFSIFELMVSTDLTNLGCVNASALAVLIHVIVVHQVATSAWVEVVIPPISMVLGVMSVVSVEVMVIDVVIMVRSSSVRRSLVSTVVIDFAERFGILVLQNSPIDER